MSWTWSDNRAVGALLFEKYDTLNPMTVRLADIRKWALDLEDFEGGPIEPDENKLKAIQKAWYEEWKREFGS
jgi:FeS assembly protein IscX